MKKLLLALLVVVIALLAVSTAFAAEPPCNDFNGDGSPSGYEYAQYHISELAKLGIIGQGHKPGTHMGFSICTGG